MHGDRVFLFSADISSLNFNTSYHRKMQLYSIDIIDFFRLKLCVLILILSKVSTLKVWKKAFFISE